MNLRLVLGAAIAIVALFVLFTMPFTVSQTEQALRADPARFPEPIRVAIRDTLRRGGYKPTGRGKPAKARHKRRK